MAITTGPEISLNDIHLEVGSDANIECSFNDEDIRALISAAAGSEMEIIDWYGAENGASYLDEQTVTVGFLNRGTAKNAVGHYYGYGNVGGNTFGTIADGTFDVKSDATINQLRYRKREGGATGEQGNEILYFEIAGTHSNDGWTTMTIGSDSFDKDDSSYFSNSTLTRWQWSEEDLTNPFGETADEDVEVQFS